MSEALMRRYYTAYNAGETETLGSMLDDGVVLESAAGTQRGRDAYLETYRYMIANFDDQMTPTSISIAGDVATVRIHDQLIARQPVEDFLGRALAAGERIELDLIGRYTIVDGRIARIEIAPV